MDLKLAWKEAVGCDWNYENKKTDTEISFTEKDGKLYISFQGSESKLDWIQNFMFGKVPYSNMKKKFFIHMGFIKKYKSVREDVLNRVREARARGIKKIEIRGFSQGAALATIAHEDILYHFNEPNTIIFGSPRVFGWWNKKLLNELLSGVTNVRNTRDLVTKIPPVLFGFKRYGKPEVKKGIYNIFKIVKNHLSYRELL